MTWSEFKKWVENNGVTDDLEILFIDFSSEPTELILDTPSYGIPTGKFSIL